MKDSNSFQNRTSNRRRCSKPRKCIFGEMQVTTSTMERIQVFT